MLANGVKETTTTTGTGTVTLAAVTGFPRFSDALAVGQYVEYAIQDGNNWEWGLGKVGAGNTLERVKVRAKYDAGVYSNDPATKLSLSGTATVFCSLHFAARESGGAGYTSAPRGEAVVHTAGEWVPFCAVASQYAANSYASNIDADALSLYPVTIRRRVSGAWSFHQAGSSGNVRFVLYKGNGPEGRPGTLIGQTPAVGTGFRSAFTADFTGGPFTVNPGDWVGYLSDANSSVYGEHGLIGDGSVLVAGEPPFWSAGLKFSATYASGAPATCPTTITSNLNVRAFIAGKVA